MRFIVIYHFTVYDFWGVLPPLRHIIPVIYRCRQLL